MTASALSNHICEIISLGSEEQMPGVNTFSIVAGMADTEPFGHISYMEQVRHFMRILRFAIEIELPVAFPRTFPNPAFSRKYTSFDFFEKTFFRISTLSFFVRHYDILSYNDIHVKELNS